MDELTSFQLSEWEAYDKLEPIGEMRSDFRMANIMSLINNLAIAIHSKSTQKTTPLDFMPKWDEEEQRVVKEEPAMDPEEIKRIFMSLSGHNVVDKKTKQIIKRNE